LHFDLFLVKLTVLNLLGNTIIIAFAVLEAVLAINFEGLIIFIIDRDDLLLLTAALSAATTAAAIEASNNCKEN